MLSSGEWREREYELDVAEAIAGSLPDGMPGCLARVLAARGVTADALSEYLSPDLKSLPPPSSLPGVADCARVILDAVAQGRRIVVYGDYDADGVCATAIMTRTLAALGVDAAGFIPRRDGEGYGLTAPSMKRLFEEHPDVGLLVTVDNGVNAVAEIADIRRRGVAVVVTDHHLPGPELPEAEAMAEPKVSAPSELENLCGAGVAFCVAQELVCQAKRRGMYPEDGPKIAGPLMILAGVATVTDLMPLVGANRTLVASALRYFRHTAPIGLKALFLADGQKPMDRLNSRDFGFFVGPRLNAAGRMALGQTAYELVSTDELEAARLLAVSLKDYNAERRSIEERMAGEALGQLDKDAAAQVVSDNGLENAWHPGVAGIVASRVLEATGVPVAVVVGRYGSARAPEGYNVRDALAACGEFLDRFGGHAAAAGFTVAEGKLEEFKAAFRSACARQRPSVPVSFASFDGWLDGRDLTMGLCEAVERLEPFGEGNPEPVFGIRNVAFRDVKAFGDGCRHLCFLFADRSIPRAVWWGHGDLAEELRAKSGCRFDLLFKVKVSDFGYEPHPELVVEDMRVSAT